MPTPAGQPERILLVRPSALGDVCRSVALPASLKRAFPSARIDWIVQEQFVPAVAAHPALSEVIPFARSRLSSAWRHPGAMRELRRWLGQLRKARYDLVIDAQGLLRSAVMAWATRAPRRIGFADARECAWLAYTDRSTRQGSRHTVEAMLALVEAAGAPPVRDMRLYVRPEDARAWRAWREENIGDGGALAVVAPGSRWVSKRWPPDRWAALCRPLLERGFDAVLIVGSPDERGLAAHIAAQAGDARVVNGAGVLGLGETIASIADASIVIANDSAPLHMAVGFDRPLVGIFGPTDPRRVGPYGRERWVVRHPAAAASGADFKDPRLGDGLMRLVTEEMVLNRVDEALADTSLATGRCA
jgi:heptosyltransferase I